MLSEPMRCGAAYQQERPAESGPFENTPDMCGQLDQHQADQNGISSSEKSSIGGGLFDAGCGR